MMMNSWAVVLASLGVVAFVSVGAQADPGKDESGHGRGGGEYKVEEKWDDGKYEYKRESGGCSYLYERKEGKVEEKSDCAGDLGREHVRRGGPADNAPAHGYRRHHHEPAYYQANALPAIDMGSCGRDVVGTFLGAAAGELAGSQIGKGTGQLAAVGAGVLLGGILGNQIGEHFNQMDPACAVDFLETAPAMQTVEWQNPDNGTAYQVTPSEIYRDESGQYCREYQSRAEVGGQIERMYGTACRQPDGSWRLMD